jgi:hypothetical protein
MKLRYNFVTNSILPKLKSFGTIQLENSLHPCSELLVKAS